MRDKINIVQQNPVAMPTPLNRVRHHPKIFFQAMLDLIGNGDSLAVVGCRGNQEKVGQSGIDWVEFKNAGIFAFFVFTGRGCGLYENASLFVRLGCAHAAEFLSSLILVSGFRSGKPGLPLVPLRNCAPKSILAIEPMARDVIADSVRQQLMPGTKAIGAALT